MGVLVLSLLGVSLVTGLVSLGISFLFNGLKGKVSAKVKYYLWLTLLVSLLLPFRPQFGSGLVQLDQGELLKPLQEAPLESSQFPLIAGLSVTWLQVLVLVWFVGVLVSLALQVYHWWKFRSLLKRWGKPVADGLVLDSLAGAKELLAITREVRVSHYPLTQTPMLVGFREPHILLPTLDYTDDELDLIFEHELIHFKHRDTYLNLLILLVTSLYWFNPGVRFMARETQEAAESYCDQDVLVYQDKAYRTFYGETLISMITRSTQAQSALPSCFYSSKFNLKRRMEAIVHTEGTAKGGTAVAVAAVLVSLFFSGSVFALVDQSALVESQPALREFPSLQLEAGGLKSKVLAELGLSAAEISNWKKTKTDQAYLIQFDHKEERLTYLVDVSGSRLTLQSRRSLAVPASSDKNQAGSISLSAQSSQASSQATSASAAEVSQAASASQPEVVTSSPSPAQQGAAVSAPVEATPAAPVAEVVNQLAASVQPPAAPAYTPPQPVVDVDDDDAYDTDADDVSDDD